MKAVFGLAWVIMLLSVPQLRAQESPKQEAAKESITGSTTAPAEVTPAIVPQSAAKIASKLTPKNKDIMLRVFDKRPLDKFQVETQKVIENELASCKSCEFANLTGYDPQGKAQLPLDPMAEWGLPESFAKESSLILINWNAKMKKEYKDLAEYLNRLASLGTTVVIAASQPEEGLSSAPLSQTFAGQVSKAIIVGELGERDRLWGASYYGPEMLTAIRPSRDRIGQGIAPVLFASRLARSSRKPADWYQFLQEKKVVTRKIWLELNDCFGY